MNGILRLLIRLYPGPFRSRFGADLEAQVEAERAREAPDGGLGGVWFTVATGVDLVRSALAERLSPTWVDQQDELEEEGSGLAMTGWTMDFRYAIRVLRRSPGFTAVTVGTLALAIGANAGIFSVVDTVLLNSLPYGNADRLVYIAASAPGSDLPDEFGVSPEFFVEYGEESRMLEDVALFNSFTSTLRTDDRVERIRMSAPTPSLFSTLGAEPVLGRLPVPEDEDRVAVISYMLWTTWFGQDPSVIGRTYSVSGADRTIIGVMGPEFRFPHEGTLLWYPTNIRPENITPGRFGSPMVGRLAPGATIEGLTAELRTLAQRIPERFGVSSAPYLRVIEQHRPIVRPLRNQLLGDVSRPLWLLLASVAIVLLIACANVANLFMVRADGRHRDLAIRRAIGAGRGQLFRSQMAESVIVALAAGGLAVVLAWVTVPVFLRAAPADVPRLGDVAITAPTLLFTAGVCLLSALLCGLLPSVRVSTPNLAGLRDGSRGSTRRRHWARDGLVVVQTALALVLLIGSGLLIRSFQQLRNVDPGYDTEDIFTFQMAPEQAGLTDGPSWTAFHMAFLDRLAALPGVESVGIVENVPLNESTASARVVTEDDPDVESGSLLRLTFSGGDYFRTMGIDVLAGRPFEDADQLGRSNIIISKSAADLLWPGESAVGRRIQPQGEEEWYTVVGVVADVLQNGFREDPEPVVYLPLTGPGPDSWALSSPAYVVKTARAETIAPEVRALVRQVAPEAPMYRIFTMEGLARDSMVQLSFTMLTLGVTSLLALILGTVGLYGVLSYVVAERTREIGVRMALGARAANVRRMVVMQGARVVLIGVVIGIVVARLSTRALGSLLYGVAPADLATFVGMSGAMVLVGLLASYVPARRASSVDPIESLRE